MEEQHRGETEAMWRWRDTWQHGKRNKARGRERLDQEAAPRKAREGREDYKEVRWVRGATVVQVERRASTLLLAAIRKPM